ncbi:hypothetical protein LguiA_002812 [Lonicera macranthoides]
MRFLSLKSREFRELQLSSSTLFQIQPYSDPKLHYKIPAAKEKEREKYPKSVWCPLLCFNHSTPLSTFIINILLHFSHILIHIWPRGKTPCDSLEEERRAWRKRACCRERKYLSATYFSSSCIIVSFC